MSAFRAGHASGTDWKDVMRACLAQLGTDHGADALGFLYVTDDLAAQLGPLLHGLRDGTGVGHWVGTVGLGVCASGIEYYDRPAAAALVADFGPNQYRVIGAVDGERLHTPDDQPWRALGERHLAVLHGDPRNAHLADVVARLPQLVPGVFAVGGLSSSRHTYYQVADFLNEGQISGVMLAGDVPVTVGLSQGCTPIGPVRTITQAQRNILVSIDGRPALEVFKEDIGEILARDLRRAAGYIFAALPVPGAEGRGGRGDYLVRNVIGVDTHNNLVGIGDQVETGAPIMFARRDAPAATEDLQAMLADVKARLPGPPRAALYHTCLGRGRSLFGEGSVELGIVRDALGDIPLAGFYANGEICGERLYGYTGVLTVFS
ncbi:FIST C-terminal domain-containing protein [Ectothiorhodospiraceae bacterium 2226]|nr:FIST C-terminal domain-containing protein [Ectothiorhodospiraceae bacterium 2226]